MEKLGTFQSRRATLDNVSVAEQFNSLTISKHKQEKIGYMMINNLSLGLRTMLLNAIICVSKITHRVCVGANINCIACHSSMTGL